MNIRLINENSNQLEIQFIYISVCLGCLVSHMTLSALIKLMIDHVHIRRQELNWLNVKETHSETTIWKMIFSIDILTKVNAYNCKLGVNCLLIADTSFLCSI